jgi:anti-sigma B factor antagonist
MNEIVIDTRFANQKGDVMIMKLSGFIDQSNSFSLQKTFDDILTSGCFKIIIDFSHVLYISSAGWGIFVGEIKRFRDEGGDIKLVNMTPDIYEVYQMLEFYHIFEDFNSIESALESFNGKLQEDDVSAVKGEQEHKIDIDVSGTLVNPGDDEISDEEIGSYPTSSSSEKGSDENEMEEIAIFPISKEKTKPVKSTEEESAYLSKLPESEKVRKIVSQYPLLSIRQIRKVLKDDRFGGVKINVIKLYRLLKELDLDTKAKRYRFYRSC